MGTYFGPTVRSNRWRQIGSLGHSGFMGVAVAAVVGSSLNPEHYHFHSAEARRAFMPDPRDVATAFLLSAGESAALWLILCVGPGRRLGRRFRLALVVFVPWLVVVWEQVGTHVPGFLMINALWVASIVIFFTGGLLVVSTIRIRQRTRPQEGDTRSSASAW